MNEHQKKQKAKRLPDIRYFLPKGRQGLLIATLGCMLSSGLWAAANQSATVQSPQNKTQNFTGKVFDSKDGSSLIGWYRTGKR